MDQTVIHATEDFLKSQIESAKVEIEQLKEHIQTVTQRSYSESAERSRMRNEMQEWTLENLNDGTLSEDTAQAIADICGFELTTEFEVEVTVMYSVTVNARDEESAQNAIHDIDFETVSYNDDNISWLSASVDRIEI
jgi:vacuolar-type H+-ATPase subunit I/STV1